MTRKTDRQIELNERAKRAIARAEKLHEEEARERAKKFSIKTFLDSIKPFEKNLQDIKDAIDSEGLSPEAIKRITNKFNRVSKSVDQLNDKLTKLQTDDRMR